MKPPQRGYWCECWTENLAEEWPPALLASFDAYSSAQADRWVAVVLRTVSPTLDADASDAAWEWLKFLTGTEAQTIRSTIQQGGCPSRKSATQDKSYTDTTIPALESTAANSRGCGA